MPNTQSPILKSKFLNSWNLFAVVVIPMCIAVATAMTRVDLSGPSGVSAMIQFSVRLAVPWLYIAFSASSLVVLFPGASSRWLLRNRKVIGLCFASAMGWQLLFIVWLVTVHSDYYIEEVYVLRDAIEGVVGYLCLIAMTLTSFNFGRKHLKPNQWKLLHEFGIYFLWAYAFSVYWWELFYYQDPILIDYVYYWSGFLACGLRVAARGKKRRQLAEKITPQNRPSPAFRFIGSVIIGIGLIAASFGLLWREQAEELLTGYAITRIPELYLPYWPFEPFFPLFIIALGAFLATKSRA
jgi:DMSO/TMAO reductase YedYZ heme-binding membrane subunit